MNWIIAIFLFGCIDFAFFAATPIDFRTEGGRGWRFLPGGGIVVFIDYKTQKEQHGN